MNLQVDGGLRVIDRRWSLMAFMASRVVEVSSGGRGWLFGGGREDVERY